MGKVKEIAKRDWHKYTVTLVGVVISFLLFQTSTYFKQRDNKIDETIISINNLTNKLQNYIDVHEEKHEMVDYRIEKLEDCSKIVYGKYKPYKQDNNSSISNFMFNKQNLSK